MTTKVKLFNRVLTKMPVPKRHRYSLEDALSKTYKIYAQKQSKARFCGRINTAQILVGHEVRLVLVK